MVPLSDTTGRKSKAPEAFRHSEGPELTTAWCSPTKPNPRTRPISSPGSQPPGPNISVASGASQLRKYHKHKTVRGIGQTKSVCPFIFCVSFYPCSARYPRCGRNTAESTALNPCRGNSPTEPTALNTISVTTPLFDFDRNRAPIFLFFLFWWIVFWDFFICGGIEAWIGPVRLWQSRKQNLGVIFQHFSPAPPV